MFATEPYVSGFLEIPLGLLLKKLQTSLTAKRIRNRFISKVHSLLIADPQSNQRATTSRTDHRFQIVSS